MRPVLCKGRACGYGVPRPGPQVPQARVLQQAGSDPRGPAKGGRGIVEYQFRGFGIFNEQPFRGQPHDIRPKVKEAARGKQGGKFVDAPRGMLTEDGISATLRKRLRVVRVRRERSSAPQGMCTCCNTAQHIACKADATRAYLLPFWPQAVAVWQKNPPTHSCLGAGLRVVLPQAVRTTAGATKNEKFL